MGRGTLTLGAGLFALTALACTPQQNAESPAAEVRQDQLHPVSGLPIITVTVKSGEKVHRFASKLAESREAQARGLMFRTALGPDEGMLFPNDRPTARSFWMKNTPIPLDIIFVGLDGRIANIAAMAEPYSEEQLYSVGSVSAVFEIAGGRASELGIEPGDEVRW